MFLVSQDLFLVIVGLDLLIYAEGFGLVIKLYHSQNGLLE